MQNNMPSVKNCMLAKNAAQLWQQIPVAILTGRGQLVKSAMLLGAKNDRQ